MGEGKGEDEVRRGGWKMIGEEGGGGGKMVGEMG